MGMHVIIGHPMLTPGTSGVSEISVLENRKSLSIPKADGEDLRTVKNNRNCSNVHPHFEKNLDVMVMPQVLQFC